MRPKTAGVSLVELLCVVVIVGIMITVFYSTFLSNWGAMENYATRAALWQDMDRIMDEVSLQTRASSRIDVATNNSKSVSFFDASSDAVPAATCTFDAAGRLVLTRGGTATLLTDRVDPALSSFSKHNVDRKTALVVHMVLADNLFDRRVAIDASTEILPRN